MNMCDNPKTMGQAVFQALFQFRGNKPHKGYFPVKNCGILNVVILNDMPKRPLKKVLCSRRHAHTCMTAWKYTTSEISGLEKATIWWFQPIWKMLVKMEILPK